jgi:Spy/CpxP family protein refolding chaperone
MVTTSKLRVYGLLLAIFVLGAGSGGAVAYAVTERRLSQVLGGDRTELRETRRFLALSRELDLRPEQREKVRSILQRHRERHREVTQQVHENCGQPLRELREKVDREISAVLDPEQRERFRAMADKHRERFQRGGRFRP